MVTGSYAGRNVWVNDFSRTSECWYSFQVLFNIYSLLMVALRGWVQTLSSLPMPRLGSERPPLGQKIQSYSPTGTLRRDSLKENHSWIMTTDTIGRGNHPMLPQGIRGDSRVISCLSGGRRRPGPNWGLQGEAVGGLLPMSPGRAPQEIWVGGKHTRRPLLPHPAQPERPQQARGRFPGVSHGGGRGHMKRLNAPLLTS